MWLDNEDQPDQYNKANSTAIGSNNQSVGSGGGTSGALGGTSTQGTATTPSNPSTAAPAQTTGPTQQYANIQDYLGNSANQQAGNTLGNNLNTSLNNTANTEQGTIQSAVNQTNSDINAGSVQANPSLISQATTNPTSITGNPGNLNSFLQQWNAAYTGPSSFETSTNYAPAVTAANEASQTGAEVADAGGRQTLLNSTYGVQGQGNQMLDQALVQNSSAFPAIQNQATNFQNVQDYLTNQAAATDTAATNAATNTAATQTAARQAFANSPTTFQNNINNEVSQAQATAGPIAQQYQTDFAAGNSQAVAADLTKMGVPSAQIQSITQYLANLNKDYSQNPNLTPYYNYNANTAITPANAATQQDYQNAAALQQLTGVDYSGILNPANAAQAGTAPKASTGLNASGLQSYLQGQVNTQDTNLLSAINPASLTSNKVGVVPQGSGPADQLFSTLNLPNVITPANQSNAAAGAQAAQALIDAATRQGATVVNNPGINAILQQAETALNGVTAGGQNINSPAHAGLLNFVTTLKQGLPAPTRPK